MPRLHDREIDEYLYRCVRTDPDALEEAAEEAPGQLVYWNEELSDAKKLVGQLKLQQKILHARLDQEARLRCQAHADAENAVRLDENPRAAASTMLKVTEAMIDAEITRDREWQRLYLTLVEAEAEESRLWGIIDGLRTKRDLLVALINLRRQELRSSMVTPKSRRQMQEEMDG